MEPKDLVMIWRAPDNTRLTARQYSLRLPIHVAAKVSALCEKFPTRSRTEIIGDLLSTALDQVIGHFEGLTEEVLEAAHANNEEPLESEQEYFLRRVAKFQKELEAEVTGTPSQPDSQSTPNVQNDASKPRAPRQRGATPTTKARTAEGPRGDQRSRKRGGRRRPGNG